MVSKGRHPKNVINAALEAIDTAKFEVVEVHNGHRWGIVRCLTCGMKVPIFSTPRVPEHNAQSIDRFTRNHQH